LQGLPASLAPRFRRPFARFFCEEEALRRGCPARAVDDALVHRSDHALTGTVFIAGVETSPANLTPSAIVSERNRQVPPITDGRLLSVARRSGATRFGEVRDLCLAAPTRKSRVAQGARTPAVHGHFSVTRNYPLKFQRGQSTVLDCSKTVSFFRLPFLLCQRTASKIIGGRKIASKKSPKKLKVNKL
jgi:hypothetical protein